MVSPAEVVLTGLTGDGRAILAVPHKQGPQRRLRVRASHFGADVWGVGVCVHSTARTLVGDWLESYLERARDDGDDGTTGADDEVFEAETFFVEDNGWV